MNSKPNLGEAFATLMGNMQPNQKEKRWWQSYSFPETIRFNCKDLMNFTRSALFSTALQSDSVVYELAAECVNLKPEEVSPLIENLGARLVYDSFISFFYVMKGGAIEVERHRRKHYLNVNIVTSCSNEMQIFKEWRSANEE